MSLSPSVTLADIVFWKAIQTAVKDMLSRDPVSSPVASAQEVIDIVTGLYVTMVRHALNGANLEIVEVLHHR